MLRIEAPNEPKMLYCCWNSCIRLRVMRRPRGRAAGDQPPAALEAQQRAVEAFAADMLEHHVDALLVGELARDRLEPVGAVVDDVVGAERLGLLRLVVVADRGDDGAADRLRHLDRGGADAGAAGLHQDGLARLELGVVEQHVLDGARTRSARRRRRACATPFGTGIDQPRRHVEQVAGEAVDMEAHDAGDVLAEIVAALAAGLADAAGQRAIHHHRVAGLEAASRRRRPRRSRRRPRRRRPAAACAWRRPCRASPRRRYG